MYELYSEFVDTYLNNISSMKSHLSHEKITSIQNNCAKVIYDLKLIRTLYSSLDKNKECIELSSLHSFYIGNVFYD